MFRPIGSIVLKGKKEPVDCFEPIHSSQSPNTEIGSYKAAFDLMVEEAPEAEQAFVKLAKANPDDPLAALHAARLRRGETGATIRLSEK